MLADASDHVSTGCRSSECFPRHWVSPRNTFSSLRHLISEGRARLGALEKLWKEILK